MMWLLVWLGLWWWMTRRIRKFLEQKRNVDAAIERAKMVPGVPVINESADSYGRPLHDSERKRCLCGHQLVSHSGERGQCNGWTDDTGCQCVRFDP